MADQKDALDRLFKACWNDEALKQRFISDPPEVLKEFGVRIPEDRKITVVENTDDRHHITLPRLPSAMLMMFRAETSLSVARRPTSRRRSRNRSSVATSGV